uniref:Purine nucleoside phosphorylase n=1 Tax=Toxocara canis TaxID=6265 RepID=A0A183U3U8_TOXCA
LQRFIFSPLCYEDLEKVAKAIKSKVALKEVPTIAIICGSGLGDLAELVTDQQILPYTEIPGFPSTKVVGHKGNLVFGYLNGKYVVCLQGRFHPYEHGMQLALCAMPVRIMHLLGVKTLIVSNAAGAVNDELKCGDLMLIKDQLFLPAMCGFSPFVGPHDERFGARFISMQAAYDLELRKKALEIAKQQGIRIFEGVYCMTAGPQYETSAEVRMLTQMGADALGMSTCHEVAVARQHGMRVFGLSLITNV